MEKPRKPTGWKGPALIVLTLCSTGCFRYVPAQLQTTAPGEAVRVLIARGGATELANISDVVEDVPIVDGTVVGVEEQDLLLQVPSRDAGTDSPAPTSIRRSGSRPRRSVRFAGGSSTRFRLDS